MSRRLARIISIICAALLLVLAGMVLAELELPPQPLVAHALDAAEDLQDNGLAYLGLKPVQHLRPLRFEKTGLVVADRAHAAPGVTLLVGLFGDQLGARLLDLDGTVVHEWPIDLFSTIEDEMAYPYDGLVHGSWLYPNGDLIANMDGEGLIRIDACGRTIWQNYDKTHHSVFVDDHGFIWSPKYTEDYRIPEISERPFKFDQVGKFDAKTGELIEEIDLIGAVVRASLEGLVLANQVHPRDMMHTNDVEILARDMANAFPQFEAGDLLLSSRNFNEIWVLDGKTHDLKWWQMGPMHGQHDPDFQPDGTITLLDNRPGETSDPKLAELGRMGGSRILSIEPEAHRAETLYGGGEDIYTPYRGKHQRLENGNVLITETDAGRALELTPDGSVVWAYVNAYDDDEVGWLMEATRYPDSFRAIGEVRCGEDSQTAATARTQ